MSKQTNIATWIEKFNAGEFNGRDVDTQINAGWYDWFCRSTSLVGKTARLAPKVKRIANSPRVNVKTMYVWFKNNCPLYGTLYDDFRFADIETGNVKYTITPERNIIVNGKNRKVAEVWGRENDFSKPLYTGDWKGVCEFFGV